MTAPAPDARHGVLVVDKPVGPTSHDVVDSVRRALGTRRVGHTGTLDPFASGVLPVCVGKATRLARFLGGGDKVYRATVRFGFATTTDDATGEPIGTPRDVAIDRGALEQAARGFEGEISQVPPLFSAKHSDGRRHHELARAGVAVSRTPCRVTIHAIAIASVDGARAELEVRCGPGTYIRALARDLGEKLQIGGHLTALRRLRSGGFGLESAIGLDALSSAGEQAPLRSLSELLDDWPAVRVSADGRAALGHGRPLGRELVLAGFPEDVPAPRYRVVDAAGQLLAIAVPQGWGAVTTALPLPKTLHADIVLVDPSEA